MRKWVGLGLLVKFLFSLFQVDLKYVKIEYEKQYGKSLYDAVRSEISGDYEVITVQQLNLAF